MKRLSVIIVLTALALAILACGPKPTVTETPTPAGDKLSVPTLVPLDPTKTPQQEKKPTAAPVFPTAPAATVEPFQESENTQVESFDPFSDPESGWYEAQNETSVLSYVDGTYEITINQPNTIQSSISEQTFVTGNVTASVEAWTTTDVMDADFGIACNFIDFQTFTALTITNEGYAAITNFTPEKETVIASAANAFTPTDRYTLDAICNEGYYKLFVNGEEVLEVNDEALKVDGTTGLFGGVFDTAPATFVFDNFYVAAESLSNMGNLEFAPIDTSGEIVFQDDFSDKSFDWSENSKADFSSAYKNGAFQINVITSSYAAWSAPANYISMGDAVIELDAKKISGPDDGDFGIICSLRKNMNFFVLAIDNTGYAEIIKYSDGTESLLIDKADAFKPANSYHLVASCVNGTASLAINGTTVLSVSDPDLINSGSFGVYGGTFDTGNAVFSYDNVVVHKPN